MVSTQRSLQSRKVLPLLRGSWTLQTQSWACPSQSQCLYLWKRLVFPSLSGLGSLSLARTFQLLRSLDPGGHGGEERSWPVGAKYCLITTRAPDYSLYLVLSIMPTVSRLTVAPKTSGGMWGSCSYPTRFGSSSGVRDMNWFLSLALLLKTWALFTSAEQKCGDRVLGKVEKNYFLALPSRGGHSGLMPSKLCALPWSG